MAQNIFSVQSRRGWSAYYLSKLLQVSGQEGQLKFLAEIREYNEILLIMPDSFQKIILEINQFLVWCRSNVDEILAILKYSESPQEIIKWLDEIYSIPNVFKFADDGDHIGWLFAYLRDIIKILQQAEEKQQFIMY